MTPFAAKTLPLSETVFTILRDLIHERTGVFYSDDKRETLAERLSNHAIQQHCSTFLDYYYRLKYESGSESQWRAVHDCLAVPETYFWREIDQIHALVDYIVPEFFAATPEGPLRIWSAACSSGEEPLTIAMVLAESGWFDRARIEIWASDASPSAIAAARRGIYRERSFRNLAPELRQRYFTESAEGSRVAPELQDRVQWLEANLMDDGRIWPLATAPVIFCRNAFIYFSTDATRKTVRLFAEATPTPAYLFVGVAESLIKLTTDFELREIGRAFVYVKSPNPP